MDPTNYKADSIKKPAHEPLGMPHKWIPLNWPMDASTLHITHPQDPPCCGQVPMHTPNGGGERKLWKMASEHTQQAGLNLQARGRPQTTALAPTLGKQEKDCQHCQCGVLQDWEKAYKLKDSAISGSQKHGASLSIEDLRKL